MNNLSSLELGALVWLLSLPGEQYLRLGLGKPLGFGSVRVEIDNTESSIADGAEWIKSLTSPNLPATTDLRPLVEQFEAAINQCNGELLRAFKISVSGFNGIPVHYPLTTDQAPGAGETYKWFVSNENDARRVPLPDLNSNNPLLTKHS